MKFKIHQYALSLSSLGLVCFLTGCVQVQTSEYAEWVAPLDPRSELSASTFPAWHPDSERVAPGFKKLTTDQYLALQFHVREKGTKFGQSPYVESIHIHSFAYHLDDSPEKVLVENQSNNFWMQQIHGYLDREKKRHPLSGAFRASRHHGHDTQRHTASAERKHARKNAKSFDAKLGR